MDSFMLSIFLFTLPGRFTEGLNQNMFTQVNEAAAIKSGLREKFERTRDSIGDYAKKRYLDRIIGVEEQKFVANTVLIVSSLQKQQFTYSWSF